jgi:hypothetical protein
MHPEAKNVLTLALLPARLNAEQAATLLGFAAHDIPTLTAARLLQPLGRVRSNTVKYFATVDLLRLREDTQWLGKATQAVSTHWAEKRERRTKGGNQSPEGDLTGGK